MTAVDRDEQLAALLARLTDELRTQLIAILYNRSDEKSRVKQLAG